jgi:hypothetical protein
MNLRIFMAAGAIGLATVSAVFAQAPVPTPAPAPVAAPSFNSGMGINAGIFVVLAGAALYAVCRSSSRV